MEAREVLEQARDALTVKRVFGEPYEKDGATVIAVAKVQGGAGGGGGEGPGGEEGPRPTARTLNSPNPTRDQGPFRKAGTAA